MPGATRDSVEVGLEQRVLSIRGRAANPLPEGMAPLYGEYEPGAYGRASILSDAVDPAGIPARVQGGLLHLRLPTAGRACRGEEKAARRLASCVLIALVLACGYGALAS
jgi:HSP20 family molecular chaperone IbpA